MSYLLKYKLLQAYTRLAQGWHPGKFVPASYFKLNISTALSENDFVYIKNCAAENAKKYIGLDIQNSENLYYAVSDYEVENWATEYNNNTISIGSKAIIDSISWKKLGNSELALPKELYTSSRTGYVYVYLTALYNINNISNWSETTRYCINTPSRPEGSDIWNIGRITGNTVISRDNNYGAYDHYYRCPDIDLNIKTSENVVDKIYVTINSNIESLIFGTNPDHWTNDYINNFCIVPIWKNGAISEYKHSSIEEVDAELIEIINENYNAIKDKTDWYDVDQIDKDVETIVYSSLSIPVPRFTGSKLARIPLLNCKSLVYSDTFLDCELAEYDNGTKATLNFNTNNNTYILGMFNNTNISGISLNLPNYVSNNTWWRLDFGNRDYYDRNGDYGAFKTATLNDITINFNDDNITPVDTTSEVLKDSNYRAATEHWQHVTDFNGGSTLYNLSYMFNGINEHSSIYINSKYAPIIENDSGTQTNVGIPHNFKGTVYFKNSKNWQDIFDRRYIQIPSYGHSYITIADVYKYWNVDKAAVFRIKDTDIVYPTENNVTLHLGSTNTTFTTTYRDTDTWEDCINRSAGTSNGKQISYNGVSYPIGIYYINNTTGTPDGGHEDLTGYVIGIGTSVNCTNIGTTYIYKDGYDASYEDWGSRETYYTNRLNHIYVDNGNSSDKYYGIDSKSVIDPTKKYIINIDTSVLSLHDIKTDY